MPDYIDNTYKALKEKVQGFDRTPEEYRKLITGDKQYRKNVFNALSLKVGGFNRSESEFDSLVLSKPTPQRAPKEQPQLPAEGLKPIEPKLELTPIGGETLDTGVITGAGTRYDKDVYADRSRTNKVFASTWNNVVGGLQSLGTGLIERAPTVDPFSFIQPLSGKQRTVGETTERVLEGGKAAKKEAVRKVGEGFEKLKSDIVTPEEQQQVSEIDFFNKSFGDNVDALISTGGRLLVDIPMGAMSGGTTFYLQGYGDGVKEYDEMVSRGQMKESPVTREFYGNTVGIVNSVLEKFAIDKIFGKGPAFKNIQKRVVADVFKNVGNISGKQSAEVIDKIVENQVRKLTSNIKSKGARLAYASAVEGGTEGLQTALNEGAKVVANKIQGGEVFDEQDIAKNIYKNIGNSALAGSIYGAPLGSISTINPTINTSVLKDIARAKTEEDFNNIYSELQLTLENNNFNQQEAETIMANARRYAAIKQTIPETIPPEVQEKIIPLVEERTEAEAELEKKQKEAQSVDKALSGVKQAEVEMLDARVNAINDQIVARAEDGEWNYFERDGKFYKQFGENEPTEISRMYYDSALVLDEENAASQERESMPTLADIIDKQVLLNGERATISVDGQTVVANIVGKPRIIELGNVDELSSEKIGDLGISIEESVVSFNDSGNIFVRGVEMVNLFSDPLMAINRNENGDVVSVTLETVDGKKRTLRGNTAEDVAYQIVIKKLSEDNEARQRFEEFVESNEPIKQEIESGQVEEVAVEEQAEDIKPVPAQPEVIEVKLPPIEVVEERAEGEAKPEGNTGVLKFADKVEVPYKFVIIDESELKPSHLPSGERNPEHTIALAQPKERGDIMSKKAQEEIAAAPRLKEVGESPNAYFGAPVVNQRGEVIQGNNRSLGLKRHYNEGGTSYKAQLVEAAESFGLTKEQVEAMGNPVLVRQVAINDAAAVELGNYDVKDLETGGKQRVDAVATVRKMSPEDKTKLASVIFDRDAKTVKEAIRDNQDDVRQIVSKYINAAQRSTIFDKEGNVNARGMDDIENIVNNLIFESGDAVLPEAFVALPYNQQKNFQKAIKFLFDMPEGASLLPEVQGAILGLYKFNESGIENFQSWLAQPDIFTGKTAKDLFSPLELKIMDIVQKAKTQSELAKALGGYSELVKGKPADMFSPEVAGISKKDAVNQQFKVEYEDITKGYVEPESKPSVAEESVYESYKSEQLAREDFDAEFNKNRYDFESKEDYIRRKFCE